MGPIGGLLGGLFGGGSIVDLLKKLLHTASNEEAKQRVDQRMEAAIPHIVEVMKAHHKTPQEVSPEIVIHNALFHLWDALLPGLIADLIRDKQDAKVKAIALPKVTTATSLEDAVKTTKAAALEVTF